jgi:ABC-type multidrug transport system fused ATPase/permease subunit
MNIAYGKENATLLDVINAAREANAHEFITRLPLGYDTQIGENGRFLSGGERTRIALARALIRNAHIILLDEATSSLDSNNEQQFFSTMKNLRNTKTIIVFTHSDFLRDSADKVIQISLQ